MRRWLFLILAGCLAACSSIDCPVQTKVETHYYIYDKEGNALKLTDTMTVASRRSDGTDTILYNLGIDISDFSLPVSYSHPEDILVFTFSNVNNDSLHAVDTVWIKKDDIPHFESVDCSAMFFHRLTSIRHTRNYIDSLVITNPSVTYDQTTEHIRLVPKSSD